MPSILFAARREAEESLHYCAQLTMYQKLRPGPWQSRHHQIITLAKSRRRLTCINDALQIAINQNKSCYRAILVQLASIQCYGGSIRPASSPSTRRASFCCGRERPGHCVAQYVQGCEQDQDQGNFDQALGETPGNAAPFARKTTPKITIENLFGLADVYLNQGDTKNAGQSPG